MQAQTNIPNAEPVGTIGKKYEFTGERINSYDTTLHRIRALRDFGDVKAGTLGGFIEKEVNLSHEGKCWVAGKATIFNNARVFSDAKVTGNARVFVNAHILGAAQVYDKAIVCGSAWVFGAAQVCGGAHVCGHALVYGKAKICNTAVVCGTAQVYDNAVLYDGIYQEGAIK